MMLQRIVLPLMGLVTAVGLTAQSLSETPAALTTSAAGRPNHPPSVSGAKHGGNPSQFGDPLPGLTDSQAMNFTVGQAQFATIDGPADGLGPIFNAQSCNACHSQPLTKNRITNGGASAVTETRFGNAAGVFNLLHQSSLDPDCQDVVPVDSIVVAHRKTTPLFGAGLIEAIPDDAIRNNVHNPAVDGVTGRAAVLSDSVTESIAASAASGGGPVNFVGRFGWKCQESTLLAFSGDAYLNEMGITNRLFTTDLAPHIFGNPGNNPANYKVNYQALLDAEPYGYSKDTPTTPTTKLAPNTLQDLPANPLLLESPTNKDDVALFTDFMELIGPPPTLPLSQQAIQGQNLFTQINCVACHKASMRTGPSTVSIALAFKNVPLYSDLLLHHMGRLGDGIVQAQAGADEMRTAPLWGLRARAPYLHDGRAQTVRDAILMHGGEARIIVERFSDLPDSSQQAIIAFLNSI
jgi:CxxC motif-containing protein (DUF1111 family)